MGMTLATSLRGAGSTAGAATILLLVTAGCEGGLPELTPEEGARVAQVAEPAAAELMRTLVGRLTGALEEGGPAHAVEFCSIEAIPLTRTTQAGLEGGLELKRTSFRYRNPANAPDQAEEAALRFFEEAMRTQGSVPSSYVQRVSGNELRYYKPLMVGEFCLQCHGRPEAMAEDVKQALANRYPGDLATGYEAGQLRGVIRVSVPADRVGG
jgi:hypothetical protein